MTKKSIITLFLIALFLTSCGTRRTTIQNPATYDVGVVINGVRWATRNVDAPGTFAKNPESAGNHFTWYRAQNACPQGWRVPTREELQSLSNTDSEWTTKNGINGRLFGITPNQIFLPAAGWRNNGNGAPFNIGVWGYYWSSTQSNTANAMDLPIGIRSNFVGSSNRANGYSVRCVSIN